jgi:polysaccharide pyruvyl transferase WcaK-like protein
MNAAYMGWLGHQNIGDEVCFDAVCKLVVDATVHHWDALAQRQFDNHKVSIIGGGTLLDTSWDIRSSKIHQLLDQGATNVFWGTGVWASGVPSAKTVGILRRSKFVGVRGPRSKKKLEALGFANAQIIGDPALFVTDPVKYNPDSKLVAINVGNAEGRLLSGTEDLVVSEINKVVEHVTTQGFEVVLFPMIPSDMKYIEQVREPVKIVQTKTWQDVIRVIRGARCVIGMKLHSCVLAAAAGIPFVSMGYRDKCYDFASSLGLDDFVVTIEETGLHKGINTYFDLMPNNWPKILERLNAQKHQYLQKHRELAEIVRNAAK